jgi:hypothetical protein
LKIDVNGVVPNALEGRVERMGHSYEWLFQSKKPQEGFSREAVERGDFGESSEEAE